MEHKYIRVKNVGFILWPKSETNLPWHAHVAKACGPVISAGFAAIEGGVVACYGRSESLGIDSRPEDSDLLFEQLGL